MNEAQQDLRDTFDGYLMFDFSKLNGQIEEAANNFREQRNDEIINLQSSVPRLTPGPNYKNFSLKAQQPRAEQNNNEYYDDLYQLADNLVDDEDDDIELQGDDNIFEAYGNTDFNLLAHLDLDPDDDIYENVLNIESSFPHSLRAKSNSDRPQKLSIFSRNVHYEGQQNTEKIQMIPIQNIDILKEEYNFDEFYRFLKSLEFLNFSNFVQKSNEDHIRIDQLINLVEIRVQMEKMCDIFSKWTSISPQISFSSRLSYFQLEFDYFNDQVNYIIEHGSQKQKHYQPREGLISFKASSSNTTQKKPGFQDGRPEKHKQQINMMIPKQICRTHSLTLSVLFFKARKILEHFKEFQNLRQESEKHKELHRCLSNLSSFIKRRHLFVQAKVQPIKRESKNNNIKSSVITQQNKTNCQNLILGNELSIENYFTDIPSKRIKGLDNYFSNSIQLRSQVLIISGERKTKLKYIMRKFQNPLSQRIQKENMQKHFASANSHYSDLL